MPLHTPAWYDEQYNNRARVANSAEVLRQWSRQSKAALAGLQSTLDVPYGDDTSEHLDIFPAAGGRRDAPVLVYIHGGYWRALGKQDQSFVAPPFVEAGAMVVIPDYALCPAVTVEHIVMQMVRAVAWVHRHAVEYGGDRKRIVVAGHSAGGQLAAMLLACEWTRFSADLPADVVKAALSLSGVFELEPLRHAPFLAPDLNLSAADAVRLSPACLPAPPRGQLAAFVGADESEEFLRQNRLIESAWGRRIVTQREAVLDRNHMTIVGDLAVPLSRVHAAGLELLGLKGSS
jgi:arylformamidase